MPITRLRGDLQIQTDSITSDKVRDFSITAADIAPASLSGALFIDGSIPISKMDPAIAGSGLSFVPGPGALRVNVDGTSIAITDDVLGVTTSVTQKGNSFNGPSQLVELLPDGKLPALDGGNLFNVGGITAVSGWSDDGGVVRLSDAGDSVGIGTATPTAKLDVAGSIKLSDSLIISGSSAPPLSAAGSARMYFDSSSNVLRLSENGGAYVDVLSGSNFVDMETPNGSIDGSNINFSLDFAPVLGSLHLFLNGVLLFPGDGEDYEISGNSITMAAAPSIGSRLVASYRKA